jgi:DNA/RNA-binding domain of Phe-tRNA-synthetase-like protein
LHPVTLALPILAGILEVREITVSTQRTAFEQLQRCGIHYAEIYKNRPISEIPGIQIARKLFRLLGIEPTKHRPSSEAMLRRFLKGKSTYSVNTLVDVSNWCALDFLLPNGAYDSRKILGNIVLRKGFPGEEYIGLNQQPVHLEGRFTLADDRGPFGSPITDSQRTCVEIDSRDIISIVYATPDFDQDILQKHLQQYAARITDYCGGTIGHIGIIDGTKETSASA